MTILILVRRCSSILLRVLFIFPILKLFIHPRISWFSSAILWSIDTDQFLFVLAFSFLSNLLMESLCGLAFHLSLSFQNPKPRYFRFIGFVTLDLLAFTLSPSFFSMNPVTLAITLFAAALLPTAITQSSANRTNRRPLASSSLSSSLSIMLLSSGDMLPPCGVPVVVFAYLPFIITLALGYFLMRDSVSGSFISLCIRLISLSCGTLSKNFSRSISTMQVYPSLRYSSSLTTACCALRFGLNP